MTSSIEVLSRSNLTVQGQTFSVGQTVTLEDTDEVMGLISMRYVVVRDSEGNFPDYGPLNQRSSSGGCGCGG